MDRFLGEAGAPNGGLLVALVRAGARLERGHVVELHRHLRDLESDAECAEVEGETEP